MRESGMRLAVLWALGSLPIAAFANKGSSDRSVNAAPNGEVVISNTSGTVDVRGWDRNEVKVTGALDEGVERVDVDTSGGRVVIKGILPRGAHRDGAAELEIQVPRANSVEVSAVSADVSSRGVTGTQRLKSVSGDVTAEVSGNNSEIRSVSGDITVRGDGKPLSLRVSSVSGSIDLTHASGKLDVVTVSGDAQLNMVEASEVRGRTTSGNFDLRANLARDAHIDVEAVSGDVNLRLPSTGGLSTEIETFSGDITGCLAGGVERVSKYGPGRRLTIRTADAGASVRAKTLSGDIDICDK